MHRYLAGLVALIALGLSIRNAAVGPTGGWIGMTFRQSGGVVRAVVADGGPAAHAGVQSGDVIDFAATSLDARIAASGLIPRAGDTFAFPILRNGAPATIAVTAAINPTNSRYGLLADLFLALVYTTFCLIVLTRASPGRVSSLLAWVLAAYALQNAVSDFQYTASSTNGSFFLGAAGQLITTAVVQGLLVAIVCSLPVGTPMLRKRIFTFIPLFALLAYGDLPALVFSVAWPVFTAPPLFNAIVGVSVFYNIAAALVLYWLAGTAATEDRVRVRWFISTIALCGYVAPALFAVNDAYIHNPIAAIVSNYATSFTLVGPVYATLRHQLIDLDVVLSRSAVYGVISLTVVLVFLALEWLANKVAEAQVGQRWSGAAQLASFAIAIAVGLSMRPLHARVERIVNAVIFRERLARLALLESFVTESDYVESRSVLLQLAFTATCDSIDTPDVAVYLGNGEHYNRIHTTNEQIPHQLDRSDRLVLQLLQQPSPFVSEVAPLHAWLIVPLQVRTETLGFIGCGHKRDRTRYLADE
ncbi:MAG TPA: hypothetical protein VF741_00175, partial [Candidatus Aquilonibacter sp.]